MHGPQVMDHRGRCLEACFRFTYTSMVHIKPSFRAVLRGTRVELGVERARAAVELLANQGSEYAHMRVAH